MKDTIAALSTSIGGPIAIIRISGELSINILEKIFIPMNNKKIKENNPKTMIYGKIMSRDNRVIDYPICFYFNNPNSYTGEDMAEIHLHGSSAIINETLTHIFTLGAVPAGAGEFTKRSFLNAKMNLAQAEAVNDIISAKTLEAAENASAQVGGIFGIKMNDIRNNLLDVVAHFHALVDYPDEDIDPFVFKNAEEVLHKSAKTLYSLAESFEKGRIMKEGIPCTILGRPNAGKSSLLNSLSGFDKAIVTDIEGTTRDLLEESIKIGPIILRITDTAGIRETDDVVEKIGVEKALKLAKESSLLLAVFDISKEISDEDLMVIARTQDKNSIAVLNKSDLESKIDLSLISKYFKHTISVCAKDGSGLDSLRDKITEMIGFTDMNFDGGIVTNARWAAVLTRAAQRAEEAFIAAQTGMTPDAVVMDAEVAISVLGELTGQTVTDDVVSKIFENFCVGK